MYVQELIRWSVKNGFLPAGARIAGETAAAKESDAVKRARWDEYFHTTKFVTRKLTDMGHKFGRFISTDGVGVSVKMSRLKPRVPDVDPYAVNQDWFQQCPLEDMRVVGIDPGCIDFVTGVLRGDSKGNPQEIRFSGGRFYQESQMTRAREWRNWRIKNHAPDEEFEECVTSLPTAKLPTVRDLTTHIQGVTLMLPDLLEHFGSPAHRKWRLQVYRRRQATLAKVVKVITGNRPKEQVLVGFGDSSVGHGGPVSRGTRGPVKGLVAALRRSARVVMVDEFRTSRICPSAWPYGGTCDTYMRRPFECKGADGTIRVPYQLKVCPHCRVVWNRDVSAAKNMLRLVLAKARSQDRPVALRRGQPVPNVPLLAVLQDELVEAQAVVE